MPRPKQKRFISTPPSVLGFKPLGADAETTGNITLLFEEYESVRLLDFQGLKQEEAAEAMGISRPTLTRVYEKARRTMAEAFILGKTILIEGGDYRTTGLWFRCHGCLRIVTGELLKGVCPHCRQKSLESISSNHQTEKANHHENRRSQ